MRDIVNKYWYHLTDPNPQLTNEHTRQEARFLSSFTFMLIWVHLVAALITFFALRLDVGTALVMVGGLTTTLTYIASRTRHYRAASLFLVVSTFGWTFLTIWAYPNMFTAIMVILPIFQLGLFYPGRWVIVLTAVSLAFINYIQLTWQDMAIIKADYFEFVLVFINLFIAINGVLIAIASMLRQREQQQTLRRTADLFQSEARFRAAVDSGLDGFFMLQATYGAGGTVEDFIITHANEHGSRQIGIPLKNLIGQRLLRLFPANRDNGYFERYKHVLETGIPVGEEYQIKLGEPNPGWYYRQIVPVLADGIAITNRDISERKRRESEDLKLAIERERVELFRHFIAEIAHDIKTPLTVLKMSTHLLNKDLPPKKDRDYRKLLAAQVDNMETLVNNILTMGSLDTAEEAYHFATVNLNTFLEGITKEYESIAMQYNQTLHFEAIDETLTVQADVNLLRRALDNLLDNAIKYNDPGATIKLQLTQRGQRGIIEVHDEGIGIPPEVLPHIFERFYRGETHRPNRGSMGLGLTMAQKIIHSHNGTIDVESVPDQGSTFRIVLPLYETANIAHVS